MWNNNEISKARAIIDAQEKQKALNAYNAEKAQLDAKYNNGGLGGFLGSIIGGIGKGIGDVGRGVYDLIGSGVASTKDLIEGKAGTQENLQAFKKDLYKTDDIKDAYAKSAGTALNAATTLATTALPMAGVGKLGGVAANTAAGAIGGVADEFQQQGANASLESAANRAISGAAGGLIGGKVAGKVGNAGSKIGGTLLNNNLATSAIGRGAIAGAAGGAAGAGTSAALGGGNIAQAALQGALQGAGAGAAQGGIMAGANRIAQSVRGRTGANATTEPTTATGSELDLPDYTKPLDYQGNEIKINKRNIVQKLGDNLAKTGERVENADLYNSLYSKTAADIVKNDTVNKLRKLGYTPDNYSEAAKISTTTNKFVDDIVKNSGASIVDNNLVDRIAKPSAENAINTRTYQKVYDDVVKNVFDTIETGDIPGRYNAADLLKASRDVNKIANKYLKKATSVNGGDLATDAGALADALFDVKRELRDLATTSVDGFGDKYTKAQLSERLKNLGATDAAIKDMMEAKNIGEFISKTAKYEDARQMAYEMQTNDYRRNAISGSKTTTNPVNRLLQDSGAGELLSVATRPAGKIVGSVSRTAGNALSKAGEALNNIGGNTTPISPETLGILTNYIGRTSGNIQANNAVQDARKAQDYQTLEQMLGGIANNNMAGGATGVTGVQTAQQAQAQAQLADIANGMNLALAAGDIKAYNQLADLYQTAYKMYEAQNPEEKQNKLSEKQQKANAAEEILNQLETMNPDYGYTVRDIPVLNLVNAGGNAYSSTADSLATQLGYMMSGATVTPAEYERIKQQYVPQPWDSEEQRRYKLQQARNVIARYQQGYEEA